MGKNKLKKFAEMAEFQHVIQPKIKDYPTEDFYLKGNWHNKVFRNNNPIVLELGCGKGEFSVGLAQKYPNKNFIGIDIKGARMWTGAKKSLELGLKNVAFLRIRIDFINFFFAENEVDEIWIPFPDPQPKKPNKRLTSPKFFNIYRNFLKDNALIHLKTDNHYLYDYTLKVLEKNNIKPIFATDDLYSSDYNGDAKEIKTFYEKQFLAEGKKITYLMFRFPKNIIWQEIPKNPAGSPYK